MARSRNIKPAFFSNDELAESNCALGRLFFIGLWTVADHNGNLEWRPKRLKAQLLPYDDCDIKKLAINLDKSGFIRYYSDGDILYINIAKFSDHQNPHKNEKLKGTTFPIYSEEGRQLVDLNTLTINLDKSRLNQESSQSDPADSLNLIPDSPIPKKRERFAPPSLDDVFNYMVEQSVRDPAGESDRFVNYYESNGWKVGRNAMKSWQAAVRNWMKNIDDFKKPDLPPPKTKTIENLTNTDWANEIIEGNAQ